MGERELQRLPDHGAVNREWRLSCDGFPVYAAADVITSPARLMLDYGNVGPRICQVGAAAWRNRLDQMNRPGRHDVRAEGGTDLTHARLSHSGAKALS